MTPAVRAAVVVFLLGGLLIAAGPASGQEVTPKVEDVDVSAYPDVRIEVTVPQPAGEVGDTSFTVREDGAERDVEAVQISGDELEIILLLDTTGSMGGAAITEAKEAGSEFLAKLPAGTLVAVLEYSTETHIVSPLSTDLAAHQQAIAGLQASGRTATYDAVLTALSTFTDEEGRSRSLIVLTDGEDNASTATLEEAGAALEQAGIPLIGIAYRTAFSDTEGLGHLARVSGGQLFQAADQATLTHAYDEIAAGLTSTFHLTYRSQEHGLTDVAIAVQRADLLWEVHERVGLPPPPPSPAPTPTPTVAPVTPLQPGQLLQLGLLARPGVAYAGAGLMFLAIAFLVMTVLLPRAPRTRLADGSRPQSAGRAGAMGRMTDRAVAVADQALQRSGRRGRFDARLERAGLPLRPAEYVALLGSITLALVVLLWPLAGVLAALSAALLAIVGASVFVRVRISRRRDAFAQQLGDTLQILSGTLRTGYGLLQAIDGVASQSAEPTASEFRRVVVESRVGRDVGGSLASLAERMGLDDLDWVVQAITIHREVGGDLAEVLDAIAQTVRERDHVRRQIKSLSAEGRISAIILVSLPVVFAAAMTVIQPDYLAELVRHPIGVVMLAISGLLLLAGGLWIRRLVRLVF